MRDAAERRLAVGFFDGVHLGHQAIVGRADAVLTFANHPLSVLSPEKAPPCIMTLEERVAAIGKPVTVLTFTRELAAMSREEFAARYLAGNCIICGENWRFGRDGAGDADWLRAQGFAVEVVPYAVYEGEPISSTRIRSCLERGELTAANAMLGRSFSLCGVISRGKGEGAKIGYPTVNLRRGVYEVSVNGERAIANYGVAPTFGERAWATPTLEVHFLRFIRPERKFSSTEELKSQIAADCEEVMK